MNDIDGHFYVFEGTQDIFYYYVAIGSIYQDHYYIDKGIEVTKNRIGVVESIRVSREYFREEIDEDTFLEKVDTVMKCLSVEIQDLLSKSKNNIIRGIAAGWIEKK